MSTGYAISLYAPWAWAILHWNKRVENRHRNFPRQHIGPVWLHASLFGKKPEDMLDEWHSVQAMAERAGEPKPERGVTLQNLLDMRGKIVGRVNVTGYVDESPSGWFVGPTGLVLSDPIEVPEMVPCRGALGLWRVPESVLAELRRAGGEGV